jgi:3-methyladenine DNA glycosylase Tag
MTSFGAVRARAERRKGGAQALKALLPPILLEDALKTMSDDRVLAEMARRIFSAGFSWSVIKAKWSGFEEAFLGFEPNTLAFQPEEFWDALTRDERIVRNGAKIMSVRENASFAREHGGFGRFLAAWPSSDEIGLLAFLAKRGARLGGNTGQMLLRALAWDGFVLSQDVVSCLRDVGLDIAPEPKSKGETGLPYTHLSRICAKSIGENDGERNLIGLTSESE